MTARLAIFCTLVVLLALVAPAHAQTLPEEDTLRLRLSLSLSSFDRDERLAKQTAGCIVLDPELRGRYSGGCKDGFADGFGEASGVAEYRGEFSAGRKHGKGTKTWPASGDRYEGQFSNDRKEGTGTYAWGPRSQWTGEKYSGNWRDDVRDGFGVYEWPSGDRYAGPWKDDAITGQPTRQMFVRARAQSEIAAAVGAPGTRVCREMTVGIGTHDWVRGTVITADASRIAVRIDDAGRLEHTIASQQVRAGDVVQDAVRFWKPCL